MPMEKSPEPAPTDAMSPSMWDPEKRPGPPSLKSTPTATPDSSLRGGSAYKKPSTRVAWTEVSEALSKISDEQDNAASSKLDQPSASDDVSALPTKHQPLGPTHVASEIDDRDVNTPDNWVPRHPALVRLTGKHPFNCEPPCDMLIDQGFITPPSLHYVRNHGKVPKLDWDTHSFSISGLVGKPTTFTMEQLVSLPSVELPVTLVCAGNRRKEQNMTKQTIGFSWGISAHACNYWRGVRLSDLLRLCEVDMSSAKHVEMVGVEVEGLPNGTYGTSIPMSVAMDPYGDVLVAYEQNGMRLLPDHGYPVRMVIPGWIGGRMVKWLDKIVVSDKPSENYYHFYDNRIMPSHVDAELAKAEGWWFRPEYLFNELNINSAINYPNNGEIMTMDAGSYTIRGYAYSGGGRKITRVELSFDGGKSWTLCNTHYPEEKLSHAPSNGKYWCWMQWDYTVDKFNILDAAMNVGEIRCRAWDEANNTQPARLSWNLMGMGNNCHFIVQVRPRKSTTPGEPFALEFLHPTVPGPTKGGWMPPPEPAQAVTKSDAVPKVPSAPQVSGMVKHFTMKEVAEHDSEESAWFVVEGSVYDGTAYLKDHPGGAASIVMNSGADATEDFLAIHSEKAKKMLEDFYIGELVDEAQENKTKNLAMTKSSVSLMKEDLKLQTVSGLHLEEHEEELVALNPKKWLAFPLIEKTEVSHDTRLFKFGLPSPEHKLGLPVGYHMFLQAKIDGKTVMRAYTPVSSDDDLGTFTLCIKVYFANVHPKFPDGGKLSQHLESMKIGDTIAVKGPLGHFEYLGRGRFMNGSQERTATKIGLMCGGTGLTPAYQVMKAVFKDPEDTTEIFLLYANQSEADILMREELDAMAAERSNIHVWYTVDRAPESGWDYSVGFINEDMIREHIPAAGEDSFVGMCGPPPMIQYACIPNLEKVGYSEDNYMKF